MNIMNIVILTFIIILMLKYVIWFHIVYKFFNGVMSQRVARAQTGEVRNPSNCHSHLGVAWYSMSYIVSIIKTKTVDYLSISHQHQVLSSLPTLRILIEIFQTRAIDSPMPGECWSERSAFAALGCWHKRSWPL